MDNKTCKVDINTEMEDATPIKVRDEIIKCFYGAHRDNDAMGRSEEERRNHSLGLVKKSFEDTGGDFNNPTKEAIASALKYLAGISRDFNKDPEMIKKHVEGITKLLEKLD